MTKASEEQDKIYESCLNILKHTSPKDTSENVDSLIKLLSLQQDKETYDTIKNKLYKNTIVPIEIKVDTLCDEKQFIACEYNKVGNRYRSPYSNQYFPSSSSSNNDDDELPKPSKFLRDMEILGNEIFQSYRALYYGRDKTSTISSVYFWNNNDNGSSINTIFASGAFIIYKKIDENEYVHGNDNSYWSSMHIVDIGMPESKKGSKELFVEYKLSTSIYLCLEPKVELSTTSDSSTNLSGILHRDSTNSCPFNNNCSDEDMTQTHIINIGKMIEDMEIDLRMKIDQLYMQKLNEIMEAIKYPKQLQPKMTMPIMFGNNNGSSMKNKNNVGNIAAAIAARASMKKNNDNNDSNITTSFNIGAAAAAAAQTSSSATTAAAASNRKKKSITNQRNNDLMKNHSMLLNEAILKRNKKNESS